MIRFETCTYCHGKKVAERIEERVGGSWRPLPASVFEDIAPWQREDAKAELVRNAPGILRWADCDCPRCDGQGEYAVEYVTCKVF